MLELQKHAAFIVLTQAAGARACPANTLGSFLSAQTYPHFFCEIDLKKAFRHAVQKAKELQTVLVICGTFFMMETVLSLIEEEKEHSCD